MYIHMYVNKLKKKKRLMGTNETVGKIILLKFNTNEKLVHT